MIIQENDAAPVKWIEPEKSDLESKIWRGQTWPDFLPDLIWIGKANFDLWITLQTSAGVNFLTAAEIFFDNLRRGR